MTMGMKWFHKYNIGLLLLTITLYLASFGPGLVSHSESELKSAAGIATSRIAFFEKDIQERYSDSMLMRLIRDQSYWEANLSALHQTPVEILIDEKDSLIYWNRNDVIPPTGLNNYHEGVNFIQLKNG